MKNRKAKKGFTIIELVIVIAVIGILAAVLIPTFSGVIEKANLAAAQEAAKNAYTQYLVDHATDGKAQDNICIAVDGTYYFEVTNGELSVTPVENHSAHAEGYATITITKNVADYSKALKSDTTSGN